VNHHVAMHRRHSHACQARWMQRAALSFSSRCATSSTSRHWCDRQADCRATAAAVWCTVLASSGTISGGSRACWRALSGCCCCCTRLLCARMAAARSCRNGCSSSSATGTSCAGHHVDCCCCCCCASALILRLAAASCSSAAPTEHPRADISWQPGCQGNLQGPSVRAGVLPECFRGHSCAAARGRRGHDAHLLVLLLLLLCWCWIGQTAVLPCVRAAVMTSPECWTPPSKASAASAAHSADGHSAAGLCRVY
jgi:hypothetical protein